MYSNIQAQIVMFGLLYKKENINTTVYTRIARREEEIYAPPFVCN